jgi:hypothetical protein
LAWDDERFERFVEATVRMARGGLPGYGHPHVLLPYAPDAELACIARLRALPARLGQVGFGVDLVPVASHVAQAVARYATRPLRDADEYARLQRDLSDPRHGVVARTAELCRADVVARTSPDAILVVCRLGALYPFGHVSAFLETFQQLLQAAARQHTLAVAYPGSADGTTLRFLGLVDPTGGYRGHVVT